MELFGYCFNNNNNNNNIYSRMSPQTPSTSNPPFPGFLRIFYRKFGLPIENSGKESKTNAYFHFSDSLARAQKDASATTDDASDAFQSASQEDALTAKDVAAATKDDAKQAVVAKAAAATKDA